MKREHYAPGKNLRPEGKTIYLDRNIMSGGGSWLVVENNRDYLWYVQNNGHDGDDWSVNNVETGGAGAIGYRLKLTPELVTLIEGATGTNPLE